MNCSVFVKFNKLNDPVYDNQRMSDQEKTKKLKFRARLRRDKVYVLLNEIVNVLLLVQLLLSNRSGVHPLLLREFL